jgi:hypothetical protein
MDRSGRRLTPVKREGKSSLCRRRAGLSPSPRKASDRSGKKRPIFVMGNIITNQPIELTTNHLYGMKHKGFS